MVFTSLLEKNSAVSSAYKTTSLCLTQFGRSLIKMRNNKGPKTDPCGTPEFKSMGSEVVPLTQTD